MAELLDGSLAGSGEEGGSSASISPHSGLSSTRLSRPTGAEFRAVVFNAARDGNLRRLKVFLDEPRGKEWLDECLNAPSPNTPLVTAARYGHLDTVRYLLSRGADPKVPGTVAFDGETILGSPALWAAAAAGHDEVVRCLVEEAGAFIDQTTNTNSTPLRGACYDGHLSIVKYLVEKGADVEIANRHGHTPLMIAAFRQKADVVAYLLHKGANATRKSNKGNTALHDAAEADAPGVCGLLLGAGAELQPDEAGVCPLLSAAVLGHVAVMPTLIEASKSQRVVRDAWKLLGCTFVDKKMDMSGGVDAWRRALDIPLSEHEQHEENEAAAARVVPEVYNSFKEIHVAEDLQEIENSYEAIRMQSLIIRERVLGGAHVETHYYLRFRGAIYCDMGMADRCYRLWMHALHLQQKYLFPMHVSTMATFSAFQETFQQSLNEQIIHGEAARHAHGLRKRHVRAVFDTVLVEMDKLVAWGSRPLFEDCCGDDHVHDIPAEKKRLCNFGLQMIALMYRLSLPLHQPRRAPLVGPDGMLLRELEGDDDEEEESEDSEREEGREGGSVEEESARQLDVPRFVRLAQNIHALPLHTALTCEEDGFPLLHCVERLLEAGADVRGRDGAGDTALHLVLRHQKPRVSLVSLLLSWGCPVYARNEEGEVCFRLIQHAWPHMEGGGIGGIGEVRVARYLSLFEIAASEVRRSVAEKEYETIISRDVKERMNIY